MTRNTMPVLAVLTLMSSGWSTAMAQRPEQYLEGVFSGAVRMDLQSELSKVGRSEMEDG